MANTALDKKYVTFTGRMVMLGFGSIGQGVLPLILRHIDMKPEQITIVAADERGRKEAAEYGITFVQKKVTQENYQEVIGGRLGKGDFLVNLSVDVESVSLIALCQTKGTFYVDTCVEPWPGGYNNPDTPYAERTNYAMRQEALEIRPKYAGGTTAIIAHGANPGLVTHFIKQALLDVAVAEGVKVETPKTREGWAKLAQKLGIKAIHIAERDTQIPTVAKAPGEFVNTWSIDGFYGEGVQPCELGWGTHEKRLPANARQHESGCGAAIYLLQPGAHTRARSWTPLEGPYFGWIITHHESISTSDFLTVREGDKVVYRPTCHYVYHPCDAAVLSLHELAGKNWEPQEKQRLIVEEVVSGMDELGVLLMGAKKGVYWYGSRLTIEEAREVAPYNNATSLQVTAPVMAGIIWALENPTAGVVEPEDLDFQRILEICGPYLGPVVGVWGDWTPLKDRSRLFPEEKDESDPWQFVNILVK